MLLAIETICRSSRTARKEAQGVVSPAAIAACIARLEAEIATLDRARFPYHEKGLRRAIDVLRDMTPGE